MSENSVPVTSLFFREVQQDLEENFHPCMENLQAKIMEKQDGMRDEIQKRGWLKTFSGDVIDIPVLGVDASTVSRDYGEISTAIAVGVVSSTAEKVQPRYFYQAVYGTSSETFSKVAGYIRVAQELSALRYATESNCWVMYDGSFSALNMDLCKFAASMPKDLENAVDDPDFLEWELVEESYKKCLLSKDSDWFTVFGQARGMGAKQVISVSKKGISKFYSKALFADSSMSDAFIPSDKLILGLVLKEDEYTEPLSYEQVFQDSHGSKVPGYGKPHTGKVHDFEAQHNRVEATFKRMKIVNFRPWGWSPVMTIHYNSAVCKDVEEVLGIVKAQSKTRSILEPMPLYLADLLGKQASSVIQLYGEINVGRYPALFKAFRTSIRS